MTAPRRRGPGRPRVLAPAPPGCPPELRVALDDVSGPAVLALARTLRGTISSATRDLLRAWAESPDVREAVAAWDRGRAL